MNVEWTLALLIALGIGSLIGLEREQSESAGRFAGVRTFPLVALLGALTNLFFPSLLPIVAGTFFLLVVIAYVSKIVLEGDVGMTTALATILTFVYGAMTVHSEEGLTLAIVLGTVTAAILAVKDPVHDLTDRIGPTELRATLKFLIIALVVLPLLPDEELEVLLGLNPRFVWLMVVFVSGLGFLGYVLTKILGPQLGIGLTGLLGGFVSSTATAVAMAEQSRQRPALTRISAFATVIASIAMFPRVLILVAVVAPELVLSLAVPLGAMTVVGGLSSLFLWLRLRTDQEPSVTLDNPFRVRPALLFGSLFAGVLLVVDLFNVVFGDAGVYGTALVAGTVDANAITLSVSNLAHTGVIAESVAVTGIVLAVVVNTLVKIGIAWVLGTPSLGRLVAGILGTTSLIGIGTVWLL
ncbi:MgtC/SapB family protein [Natronoglomus mannanivorans]|uniref:MgtC/SapB family protein n=1 Tax=Natronoglomus mannanivorans TaxID=2979990 RepID=A0AAP2Z4Q4_9EURY|nr:MgtC/SapB family protein [Halobacteria archaeon AArc-xg1-1]